MPDRKRWSTPALCASISPCRQTLQLPALPSVGPIRGITRDLVMIAPHRHQLEILDDTSCSTPARHKHQRTAVNGLRSNRSSSNSITTICLRILWNARFVYSFRKAWDFLIVHVTPRAWKGALPFRFLTSAHLCFDTYAVRVERSTSASAVVSQ